MKDELLDLIAQTIFDKKGINILALDLRSISTLTDYVVIAEGHVDKHVIAIACGVRQALAERGVFPLSVEGLQAGDWVVLDYPGVMVHLFMPGMRDKYQLEQLWRAAEIVDVDIALSSPCAFIRE